MAHNNVRWSRLFANNTEGLKHIISRININNNNNQRTILQSQNNQLLILTRRILFLQIIQKRNFSSSILKDDPLLSSSSSSLSLNLYNSLSGKIEPLSASLPDGKALACYTCGPTVYAPAHLGHARTYVWLDIIRRFLEYTTIMNSTTNNYKRSSPLFVLNITDVDDKILAAASANNDESPIELARRYEKEFWYDWDELNCLRPHIVTRVTEHVDTDIIPYIQKLINNGMAYEINNNDDDEDSISNNDETTTIPPNGVYFDVRAYNERMGKISKYGKLAPSASASDLYDRQQQQSSSSSVIKRDVRDFVLWKKRKYGESMYWSSPWGDGRPGWHIECSAMIDAVQKQFCNTHTFTLHTGGIDLKFPHHTNEIAQAEAYNYNTNKQHTEWIQHWIHTGHLHIDGLKMSKSLKNFITIQEMLSSTDSDSPSDDFRLWCLGLSGSYRASATYSIERINESRIIREKIIQFLIIGEQFVQRQNNDNHINSSNSKKWKQDDIQFYQFVNNATNNSINALFTDLDGSTFVKELVTIAETGSARINSTSTANNNVPIVEPIIFALQNVRHLLNLVGFTDKTCRAGQTWTGEYATTNNNNNQSDLLGAITEFRSAIRRTALNANNDNDLSLLKNNILTFCDELRDKTFPSLGVDLIDGKIDKDTPDTWRYCVPKKLTDDSHLARNQRKDDNRPKSISEQTVTLDQYFRVGQYEGMFSDYDKEGFPIRNADGTDLSKRLVKKLRKKFEKHKTHLGLDDE